MKTLFSVRDTAESLGVSPDTVWREIRKGLIQTVRIRSRVLIPASEVERVSREGCQAREEAAVTV